VCTAQVDGTHEEVDDHDLYALGGANFIKISSTPHEVIYKEHIKNPSCLDCCDTSQLVNVSINQVKARRE
jgi:hypothetical protein